MRRVDDIYVIVYLVESRLLHIRVVLLRLRLLNVARWMRGLRRYVSAVGLLRILIRRHRWSTVLALITHVAITLIIITVVHVTRIIGKHLLRLLIVGELLIGHVGIGCQRLSLRPRLIIRKEALIVEASG